MESTFDKIRRMLDQQYSQFSEPPYPIELTTSLEEDLNFDSLDVIEIVISLEEGFRIEIADEEIIPTNFKTVQDIVNYVEKKINPVT